MDYKKISIEELDVAKKDRIPCILSNIHTIGALVDAMNDIKHAPLSGLSYKSIQSLVESVEEMGIEDVQIYPIHLAWYYPVDPVKSFDISELPNDTEIDELDLLPRLKNTYKLAGIFTIDDLERAFNDPDFGQIDYLLQKDIFKTSDLLEELGRELDDCCPDHLDWKNPKEDRTRYKISSNAPARTEKIEILRLSARSRKALENTKIYTLGDFLDYFEKDSAQNISGLGDRSREEVIQKFREIGYYL